MAKRKNYKFTNRRHSKKAVMSTFFGILSTLSLIAVIYMSYRIAGDSAVNYGFTGLLIALFSLTGIILGLLAVQEKDRYKVFAWIGLATSAVAFFGIGSILYIGTVL